MRCAVVQAQAGVALEAPQPSRQHLPLQPAWLQPSIIHTTTGKKIEGVRINSQRRTNVSNYETEMTETIQHLATKTHDEV